MAALRAAGPLLIETDSPYLAPVPYRGKTNNPSYVPLGGRQLAEVKGLPVEAHRGSNSLNFERLFLRTVSRSS